MEAGNTEVFRLVDQWNLRMCKINSSEQDIPSYKCNSLNFSEHEFNSALSANFVSTNLKTSVEPGTYCLRMRQKFHMKFPPSYYTL